MTDHNLTKALQEAYASANPNKRIIDTLQLSHPSFDKTVYVVKDYRPDDLNEDGLQKMTATIETGEEVDFLCFSFDFSVPDTDTSPVPEMSLTIDNISRELMNPLRQASQSNDDIIIRYRAYTEDNLNKPALISPITLIMREVKITCFNIIAVCRAKTIGNNMFPSKKYNINDYMGLIG